MLIDLQIHSTYSDGFLTPTEAAKFLHKQGVKVASLTDHNTVAGIEEFRRACLKYKMKPIPGLELYVKLKHQKMNLLWYNFDEDDSGLHDLLRDSQIRRRASVRRILVQLSKKKFKIDVNKILDKFTHYIPINHVVAAIWETPFNRQVIKKDLQTAKPRESEIIKEYFYNQKKYGRLHESYLNIERIVKLRKSVGGQLILNHPGKYNHLKRDLLTKLKKLGIDGMEVMSPHHSIGSIMYAQFISREMNFITTGGSDFHLHEGCGFPVQNSWGYFKIDSKYLRNIKEIIG